MTSPLRRKRPTTAPGRSTPARTPARLAAAALLLLAGGLASAQEPATLPPLPSLPAPAWHPPAPPAPAAPGKPLSFHKPAAPPLPGAEPLSFHKLAAPPLPGAGAPPPIRPALFQGGPPGTGAGTLQEFQIQLLPPSFERLTPIKSEAQLREQIRQELRDKTPPDRAIFPEERPASDERFAPRRFAPQLARAEPSYVCYGRLYFQDRNSERYGWDLGVLQPFVSAGLFFADVVTLPYHFASRPLDCNDCSAGQCLPGDPVPYLLYPPGLSVTGAIGEAGAILGLIAIFP